ncbi:unnamed protein product [Mytilus edulis]|uniref:VLIG-type G domain-containing protein n=1 Tax=Mytilus edulis TaxID=6550 RepID=A0A8S3UWX0_MYTED|nr:unnamed protein product [Mytilus edulis]
MQGRQKFLEILDEMTKEAADQENIADIHSFSQVINFDCNKDIKGKHKKTKEEIRIEKLRINAQKTHEMEINQRAQILATELRGDTPSEDVLKDKFNVLWETWMSNFMSEISEDRVSIKDEIESLLCEKFCSDAAFVKCEAHDSESNPDIIHADAYELIQEAIKSTLEGKYEPKLATTIVQISEDEFRVLNNLNQLEKVLI